MKRIAILLLAAMANWPALLPPARAQERRVALVMRDPGSATVVTNGHLLELSDRLWGFGVEVIDTSRGQSADEVLRVMPEFERKLDRADVAVLYYAGVARAERDRTVLLTGPQVGQAGAAPPTVQALLSTMRERSRRSFVVLDIVRARVAVRGREQAGVGALRPEAGSQLVAFTSTHPDQLGQGGLALTAALLRHLDARQSAMGLTHLATLVKEDVALETGGLQVPWVLGSLEGVTELRRVEDAQARRIAALGAMLREKRCAPDATDPVVGATAAWARAGNRRAAADPGQLASADIYDMLWALRVWQGDCRLDQVFGPRVAAVRAPPPPAVRPQRPERPAVNPAPSRPAPQTRPERNRDRPPPATAPPVRPPTTPATRPPASEPPARGRPSVAPPPI